MLVDRPPLFLLAAGQGTRLRPLTDGLPKCMVPLHGRPLAAWNLAAAVAGGVGDVILLTGYCHTRIELPTIDHTCIHNPDFATTNMVATLACAEEAWTSDLVVAYGDIVYEARVMASLLASPGDIVVVVDRQWRDYWHERFDDPLSDAESLEVDCQQAITSIGQRAGDLSQIQGQYIGLVRFRRAGVDALRRLLAEEVEASRRRERGIHPTRDFGKLYMTDILQGLIDRQVAVQAAWTDGGWLEIDSPRDLEIAHQRSEPTEQGLRILR